MSESKPRESTSSSTLKKARYDYDAIGRLQEAQLEGETSDIGEFIRLGPLGTALLPTTFPRVLLIDEIDKSNIDLPNDLLNIFEEGEFKIPELARLSKEKVCVYPSDGEDKVPIIKGQVTCHAFPFVVLTSNGEREFPPAFLRRCLRLEIEPPSPEKLAKIVDAHFADLEPKIRTQGQEIVKKFLARREKGDLATDQLFNAIYLMTQGADLNFENDKDHLINAVLKYLRAL